MIFNIRICYACLATTATETWAKEFSEGKMSSSMKLMAGIMAQSLLPILAIVAGIVAGIWLLFLGEWKLVIGGVVAVIAAPFLISLLLMLTMPIAALIALVSGGGNNKLAVIVGVAAALAIAAFTNAVVVAFAGTSFLACTRFFTGDGGVKDLLGTGNISIAYVPYLILAWVLAVSPWLSLASKDPDNEMSNATAANAALFFALFLSCFYFNQFFAIIVFIAFAVVQILILPPVLLIATREKSYM